MKTFILRTGLFVALFFVFNTSKAQWVTIPDTAFVSYLQATFPSCMNGNLMDTSCSSVVNATIINCKNKSINDLSGIEYFKHLKTLNCSFNSITTLHVLPDSLLTIDCSHNQITSIYSLPNTLTSIVAGWNFLNGIPNLPSSLVTLNLQSNQINLLPVLPNGLTHLECSINQITSLPILPNTLTYLGVCQNELNALPALPATLVGLNCNRNHFTQLPNLPDSLVSLDCDHNLITSLPVLPYHLLTLQCYNNPITSLPDFPIYLHDLDCDSCPNLHCLPYFYQITYLRFDSANIKCVSNYGNVTFSNTNINNLPLCSSLNPNPCEGVNSIGDVRSENLNLTIYPNPASSAITISIDETLLGSNLTITDLTGREVLHSAVQIRNPQFDIRNLSQGIYFITIENRTGSVTKKLVKQ